MGSRTPQVTGASGTAERVCAALSRSWAETAAPGRPAEGGLAQRQLGELARHDLLMPCGPVARYPRQARA